MPQPKPTIATEITSRSRRPRPVVKSTTPATPRPSRRAKLRRLGAIAQYPLAAVVGLAGAYSATIGQWLVLVYAVYAFIARRDSRLSFGIALFLLITIPLFEILKQPGIAENAAIYVYELLVVGTIQAIIELRKSQI